MNLQKICTVEGEKASEVTIDNFPWDDSGYFPKTKVAIWKDTSALNVEFTANDLYISAENTEHNSDVFNDSCVELFISPKPNSDVRYINFETNANGVMHVGIGKDRFKRTLFKIDECRGIKVKASRFEEGFIINLKVDFAFFEKVFGSINFNNCEMNMNLYKCGEKTKYPHFAC